MNEELYLHSPMCLDGMNRDNSTFTLIKGHFMLCLGVGPPDIPSRPTCVHVSFELSTEVSATIPFFLGRDVA